MKTMDRTSEVTSALGHRNRSSALLVVVAAVALVLGALGGWFVRGDDDVGTGVAIGGGELTARQEEMLDIVDGLGRAWLADDADAVVSYFAPGGVAVVLGNRMNLDELHAFVERGSWSGLELHEPVLVGKNSVAQFHEYGGGELCDIYEFTTGDEPMLMRHTIVR